MVVGGYFGCFKITFDRISRHFRSILNFVFKKWQPAAICVGRFSPKLIGTFQWLHKIWSWSRMKLWRAQAFYKLVAIGYFVVPNMNLIWALVSHNKTLCETQAFACGSGGDGVHTENIISRFFRGYNNICITEKQHKMLKIYTMCVWKHSKV